MLQIINAVGLSFNSGAITACDTLFAQVKRKIKINGSLQLCFSRRDQNDRMNEQNRTRESQVEMQ